MRKTTIVAALVAALAAGPAFADAYKDGIAAGNSGDFVTALKLLTPLAEKGDARAQFAVGQVYHRGLGEIDEDPTKARHWYEKAARQGNANAQSNLGVIYATGDGVPQDDRIAEKWFRLAADQGNQDAKDNLAVIMRRRLN
jgi:hypothetical protein